MLNEKGVSLIESLLVIVVIGSILFLMANIPNALQLVGKSKHMNLAREIAVKQIEDKRAIDYADIALGSSAVSDYRLGMLPRGSGTVTVGVEDEEGEWVNCDASICANGEDVKQLTVTVNWHDNKPQTITLKTMIGEGGINQ